MEKLWNVNYIRVMLTNFALFFSFYLVTPLLPLYLSEEFGATKDVIGVVLSGYTLTALLIRPFSGYVVDSFPRKTVLLICLLFYFLFFFGYIVAGSLLVFAIFRTLHGAPFGATTVANSTMAIDVLPSSRRNEGIGFYGVSNNLATAIAPSIGLFIYKITGNFQVLFWISLVIASFALLFASMVKPREYTINKDKRVLSLDRFFLVRGWFLAVNMAFFGFCWGVMSNYLAIYGKETLGITAGTGIYFLILSSGLILSRIQGSKALREGHLVRNAAEGILLSMVGYTVFIAWPSEVCYYLSALMIGLGNGHMWPAFQNMMIELAHSNERGTANSTTLTSWDLGMGLGVLLGGVIAEGFGYSSAFWSIVGAHLIGTLLFFVFTRIKYSKQQKYSSCQIR